MLQFWNTLHRKLEEFRPIRSGHVGLYTCGPTVYLPISLGNWRAFVFDDVLKRSLQYLGYEVRHVMNITDVGHLVGDGDVGEDKVERTAAREGKTAWDIAKRYEGQFREGMQALHISRDSEDAGMTMPRVTDHVPQQIAVIEALEHKGFTYLTSDGVYFDTSKFPRYGALSGQKLEDKEAGARVEVNEEKRHPSDFALWKFSPSTGSGHSPATSSEHRRDMEWSSPWGVGFPGWHIECSAMAREYLGQPFDIHCGGVDHIAVHHENEIAQSEAAFAVPLANYWLHNEFLLVDGGRMGKSLGNAYTLEDIHARGFDPVDFRYFCLGAHYRSKLNFTWEGLEGARNALAKLRRRVSEFEATVATPDATTLNTFRAAIEDDLAMPKALAVLWELMSRDDLSSTVKRATLYTMDEVFGLGAAGWSVTIKDIPMDILDLQRERDEARLAKDWSASDRLRDALQARGWVVEDKLDKSVLRKA